MTYIGNGMCMNPECALYPKRRKKNKGHAHKVLSPKYIENATQNASAPKTRSTKQTKKTGMVRGAAGEQSGWPWRLLIVVLCAAASAATAAGVREWLEKRKQ